MTVVCIDGGHGAKSAFAHPTPQIPSSRRAFAFSTFGLIARASAISTMTARATACVQDLPW
jgi:hypothetical protein